jgi:hypothetical protein
MEIVININRAAAAAAALTKATERAFNFLQRAPISYKKEQPD